MAFAESVNYSFVFLKKLRLILRQTELFQISIFSKLSSCLSNESAASFRGHNCGKLRLVLLSCRQKAFLSQKLLALRLLFHIKAEHTRSRTNFERLFDVHFIRSFQKRQKLPPRTKLSSAAAFKIIINREASKGFLSRHREARSHPLLLNKAGFQLLRSPA